MDIVAVIDVSGSMNAAATVEQDGKQADVGFSVLDITKHGLKTIIASLCPDDRLCIVVFSSKARCVMGFTPMTAANQAQASSLVDGLHTEGVTNLWDGLHVALDECERNPRAGAFSSIYLLTDGEPTENLCPPQGIAQRLAVELERIEEAGTSAVPSISTFGFGYRLDTMLLVDIAARGNGSYSFIPDAGMVGTVFVHALANAATTAGKVARLNLQSDHGAMRLLFGDPKGEFANTPTTLGITLGSLQHGQSREVLVAVKVSEDAAPADGCEFVTAQLLHSDAEGKTISTPGSVKWRQEPFELDKSIEEALLRLEFVEVLTKILPTKLPSAGTSFTLPEKQARIQSFLDKHSSRHAGHGILVDTESQVKLAVSREDWWRRWGCNYICSMLDAHRQQRCNNFKDQSVAPYGGVLFQQERERADDIFCTLPAPIASRPWASGAQTDAGVAGASFQALFHDASNGCFHGDCLVTMADGAKKKISDLQRGDQLARPRHVQGDVEGTALPTVVCVVRTDCKDGIEPLVTLGDLVITPWHPMWDASAARWAFPRELAPERDTPCQAVWNLVLDGVHQVEIGGATCVTLAHGIGVDDVVKHDYFGTNKVLRDLQAMPGFATGLLHFQPGSVARANGRVVGYQASHLVPLHTG